MNNIINDSKVSLGGGGYVDSILKLEKGFRYNYVHNSWFSKQKSDLASIVGP